jgi:hypothetical protein
MPSWLVREVSTLMASRVCSCAAAGGIIVLRPSREAAIDAGLKRRIGGFGNGMAFLEIGRHKVVGCAQLYEEIGKIHTQYG